MAEAPRRDDPVEPQSARDQRFMRIALDVARAADYPFGAVIAAAGTELARGGNEGVRRHDPTAHGEMVAIRAALAAHGAHRLIGATLYTTGEPCPMCMGAILWCGFGRLVYAAAIPQLAMRMNQILVGSAEMARRSFAPIEIVGGILQADALALFDRRGGR